VSSSSLTIGIAGLSTIFAASRTSVPISTRSSRASHVRSSHTAEP
jgi:hypothetical protein